MCQKIEVAHKKRSQNKDRRVVLSSRRRPRCSADKNTQNRSVLRGSVFFFKALEREERERERWGARVLKQLRHRW